MPCPPAIRTRAVALAAVGGSCTDRGLCAQKQVEAPHLTVNITRCHGNVAHKFCIIMPPSTVIEPTSCASCGISEVACVQDHVAPFGPASPSAMEIPFLLHIPLTVPSHAPFKGSCFREHRGTLTTFNVVSTRWRRQRTHVRHTSCVCSVWDSQSRWRRRKETVALRATNWFSYAHSPWHSSGKRSVSTFAFPRRRR